MHHRSLSHRPTLLGVVALALAATGALSPAQAATSTADRTTRIPAAKAAREATLDRVALLSGDTVVLRTDTAGRTQASLTPTSPHAGKPVRTFSFGGDNYVIPQLPVAEMARLEPSAFNVSALLRAKQAGKAPLLVTFAPGAEVHDLPGLRVDRAGAAKRADGSHTAPATISDPGALAHLADDLADVTKITGRTASTSLAAGDFEMFTTTMEAVRRPGKPIEFGMVSYMNVDDGRLAVGDAFLDGGTWKVSLPAGHYWMLVQDWTSGRVVVQEVEITSDQTVTFDMSTATVRQKFTLAGHKVVEQGDTLTRVDARGKFTFIAGFGGVAPRLNPVPAPPKSLGTFTTSAEATLTDRRQSPEADAFKHLAVARKIVKGVPESLTFNLKPADFAKIPWRSYSTGKPVTDIAFAFGMVPSDFFVFISGYPIARPGTLSLWALADKRFTWLTEEDSGKNYEETLAALAPYGRGQHKPLHFYRGPLGPGLDVGGERNDKSWGCALCVSHGRLHGTQPMIASSGTDLTGYTFSDNGRWKLTSGRRTLAKGFVAVAPYVKAPRAGTALQLQATHRAPSWSLSSKVSDTWTFTMPGHNTTVPILRARYQLPIDLSSRIGRGKVSFPVTFDNLGPVDARVKAARVRYSAGKGHWRSAKVSRIDKNTFRVSFTNPASGPVNLELWAKDAAGRTVLEQAEHAYAVSGRGKTGVPTSDQTTSDKSTPRKTSTKPRSRAPFDPKRVCRTAGKKVYSCFTHLERRHTGPTAKRPDPKGWGARDLRDAYDIPNTGSTDTVGIVVAFDYPKAEQDMNKYRKQFGLPSCTSASGCFTKINQKGGQDHYPQADYGWALEAALDLQMVSAACPTCKIVLAEARVPTTPALRKATLAATAAGATVVNHSYGIQEYTGIEDEAPIYDRPGVTDVVASGDYGFTAASFPASVPGVVSVGGTTLSHADNPRGWLEKAWAYGGSGCSAYFAKPAYQSDEACHMRTFADMSAVADDLAVYDTFLPKRYRGWLLVGGTSASSPLTAGLIGAAGAGGMKPAQLYSRAGTFTDVTAGKNGFCTGSYMCQAKPGFDAPTGLGTPQGIDPFATP